MNSSVKNNGATGSQFRLRPFLVLWHRWFGLFAALWLALMGITGSIIVFYTELDTLINPSSRTVAVVGDRLPMDQLVRAAMRYKPGSYVSFINLPSEPSMSAQLSLKAKKDSDAVVARGTYLLVNPYTGEILSERVFGAFRLDREYLMDFLYQLHIDLKMGDWMVWFLGLVSFLWLLDHLVVPLLSFPSAAKWMKSFKIRFGAQGHRFVFDLHRAGGLWFFPITFVLALSGTYLNWYYEFAAVVETFSEVTHRYNATAPYLERPVYDPKTNYEAAIKLASERADKDIDMITYFPWQEIYLARAYDDRDIDMYGRRLIAIDAKSDIILDDFHAASGTAADQIMVWQYPLHSGKAFGWTGRIIIFVSGIVVTIFSITGILLWWRKRKARLSNKRR
jgi:uncharacterized iron-regulated membrane protein